VIGPAPEAPALLHCAGFGGHGVMHAPAAGRAVAELVTLGTCRSFDLHPLRPERFAEGDLVVETAVL
jgi:FAD-dependent oxidoreductase domain-containing protein 1